MIKSFKMIEAFRYIGKYGALTTIESHISDVINAIDSACDIISRKGYDPLKYEYLIRELGENSKFIQNVIINIIQPNYKTIIITEGLFSEYLLFEESKGCYKTYEAIEFDIIDNDLCKDVKTWAAVKDTQYYTAYYKLQDYGMVLAGKHFEYELYKSLEEEIVSYKPTKAQRLEAYFTCDNFNALKSILHNDLRGKRGKDVAMVLVALEKIGCNLNGDFKPLFDNILSPIYGVIGSRQAVTDQIPKIRIATESSDPKIAKQIAEISEKYRIRLQ